MRVASEIEPLGGLGEALCVSDFAAFAEPPISRDPLGWPGYADKLAMARERTGLSQAVVAGTARVDGERCVLAVLRFEFLGGSMGEAEGRLIADAIAVAGREGLPLVSVARSGGARMQEGTVALLQMPQIARALVALAAAGAPHVTVVDDPTTGGIWAALVAGADIIIGRPGAQVAFAGSRVLAGDPDDRAASTVEGKHRDGYVDVVADGDALGPTVGGYLRLLSPATRGALATPPVPTLPAPAPGPSPAGWDSVQAARSAARRPAKDYLDSYLDDRLPVWGDRSGGTDPSVSCGFGRRDGRTVAFVCQHGGKVGPAGFRTASRLLALAERCSVPVVTFIDTAGADNSPRAEHGGVGTAIALLLQQVARLTVPLLSVVVGQGISGGAVALVNPDNLWMAPDSYLAVITPEAAAAILKRSESEVPEVARQLALWPAALEKLGLSRGQLST
ncbi:MAG: carboxyl transferase domain-containing protein [Mycobacteriales bacterium]